MLLNNKGSVTHNYTVVSVRIFHSSTVHTYTNKFPLLQTCITAPTTYSTAANCRQSLLPSLEQTGIPMGTPTSAPAIHAETVHDLADASSFLGRWSSWKCCRKEGSTISPPMKPTEYPKRPAVRHDTIAARYRLRLLEGAILKGKWVVKTPWRTYDTNIYSRPCSPYLLHSCSLLAAYSGKTMYV